MDDAPVKTDEELANEAYFIGLIVAAQSAQAKAELEAHNSPEAFAARLEAERAAEAKASAPANAPAGRKKA